MLYLFLILSLSILVCQTFFVKSEKSRELQMINYTGGGVTQGLQDLIIKAIANTYNQYKDTNYALQAHTISAYLEANTNYQFTVIFFNESPVDSWFQLQALDEVYVIWNGVNKMQISWTYCIFANARANYTKSKNEIFYWTGSIPAIGKGISQYTKQLIIDSISSLQKTSCSFAGKQLGNSLKVVDRQDWTSICKAITDKTLGGYLVTTNQQYYAGKGAKCVCIAYV